MRSLFSIGAIASRGKWERVRWDEFVSYAKEHNVDVVYIDLSKPIEEQGAFDIIFQKIVNETKDDEELVKTWHAKLQEYHKAHPEVVFIDDLDAMDTTFDREKLNNALQAIKWPDGIRASVPRAQMLYANDVQSINKATKNLRFPLIVKPKDGSTIEFSHLMRIVSKRDYLVGCKVPCLLQEFINHEGMVFKAYVIGDFLGASVKPSIRNIGPDENFSIEFHSQYYSGLKGFCGDPKDLESTRIPLNEFQMFHKVIQEQMNLKVFGFDIIIGKDGVFHLIDVNYFPSYRTIDDKWGKFLAFFTHEFQQAKLRNNRNSNKEEL